MRKILFWIHLIAGSTAAIVILIMSVTGILLMYERQMIAWADREYRSTADGDTLPPEALLDAIAARKDLLPSSLILRSDPAAPVEAAFGRQIVYFDAYLGTQLGEGAAGIRQFFQVVTGLHRYLALEGPRRQFGKAVTGAANLMFLGLALSGMYLWLPQKWKWKNVRAVLLFRGGLSGKARDFNWHNVIGIWSAIPLICIIAGATVISYPWATSLVYRIAGEDPPKAAGAGGGLNEEPNAAGLNEAWRQAIIRTPGWETIAWRASGGERISLAIAGSHRGRVDLKSTLLVDRATGEVVEHKTYESYSRARQWRLWLRFIHTGEALGVAGQTLAGVVSAGAAVMVWTGIALTWRRFRAWRTRKRMLAAEMEPAIRA